MLSIGKNTSPAPASRLASIDEEVGDVRMPASNPKMTLQRVENVTLNGEPSSMDRSATQTDAATALKRRSGIDRILHDVLRKASAEQLSGVARFAAAQRMQPAAPPRNASFVLLCSALHHMVPGNRTSDDEQHDRAASTAPSPDRGARMIEIDKPGQTDGDNLHVHPKMI